MKAYMRFLLCTTVLFHPASLLPGKPRAHNEDIWADWDWSDPEVLRAERLLLAQQEKIKEKEAPPSENQPITPPSSLIPKKTTQEESLSLLHRYVKAFKSTPLND